MCINNDCYNAWSWPFVWYFFLYPLCVCVCVCVCVCMCVCVCVYVCVCVCVYVCGGCLSLTLSCVCVCMCVCWTVTLACAVAHVCWWGDLKNQSSLNQILHLSPGLYPTIPSMLSHLAGCNQLLSLKLIIDPCFELGQSHHQSQDYQGPFSNSQFCDNSNPPLT